MVTDIGNSNEEATEEVFSIVNGIDSHQHFWKFNPIRDSWITPEMSNIQRDFLPADLLPVLKQNGFEGCIAVQADQSKEQNEFLLQLAHDNHFIKGIVGWVDLQAQDVREQLSHYHQYNIIKGFRHVLQGEQDRALMLKPAFMNGIAALKEFNFTYDILVYADQLKYIPQFVAAFPDQKFVLDHIGKPNIKDRSIDEWTKDIMSIAVHDNVFCKVSGMITEADWKHWTKENIIPYIEVVLDAFGPDNIMFGSDWPVCLLAASYPEMLDVTREYLSTFTQDEQDKFYRKNATNFYNLDDLHLMDK